MLSAPRGLNEPVFWKLSHLSASRTPARSPRLREESTGVVQVRPDARGGVADGLERDRHRGRSSHRTAPGRQIATTVAFRSGGGASSDPVR